MSIRSTCPNCRGLTVLLDKMDGHAVRCPDCGESYLVGASPAPAKRSRLREAVAGLPLWIKLAYLGTGLFFFVLFALWAAREAPSRRAPKSDDLPVDVDFRGAYLEYPQGSSRFGGVVTWPDPQLFILLGVTNASPTKVIDFESWSVDYRGVSLEDEHGNRYRAFIVRDSTKLSFKTDAGRFAQLRRESIHPGTSMTDALVFDEPAKVAKKLTLILPRRSFGGRGEIKLEIATALIAGWPSRR